jgi:hypothetical protein
MKTAFAIFASIPLAFLGCSSGGAGSVEAEPTPPTMVYGSPARANPDVTASTKELAPFGSEGRDAPSSIRQDIAIVYNTPSPSEVKPELIGPVQFVRNARIHEEQGTVTLPLYEGHMASGESAWYVLTDVSNADLANHLGLGFSAKLPYADHGKAVRTATIDLNGAFVFAKGRVDFSPVRSIVPGPDDAPFPPKKATPGSVGDADYTPIVKVDGVYYNAPIIAFDISASELQRYADGSAPDFHDKVHDKVVAIDPGGLSVTMKTTVGFSFGRAITYMSTDANNPVAATLEASTLTPALDDTSEDVRDIDAIPGQGNERIVIVVNGPRNSAGAGLGVEPYQDVNPFRQGLESAIADGRDPLNIFGGIPTINLDYSPIWDAEFVGWTQPAIDAGYRTRLIDLLNMFGLEKKGVVANFDLKSGKIGGAIRRSGVLINCPVLSRFM